MVVSQHNAFSVDVVDSYHRRRSRELPSPYAADETLVEVDPNEEYLIRLQVLPGNNSSNNSNNNVDPDRVFLFYVSIDDVYLGYRQCVSQRSGFVNVGLFNFSNGVMTGTDQAVQFREAKLLLRQGSCISASDYPFDTDLLQMGKITVKIYAGIYDGSSSIAAFSGQQQPQQKLQADAYQPGQYLDTITIRCCTCFELGYQFLSMEDYQQIQQARNKRKGLDNAAMTTEHSRQVSKRMRTETGFVPISTAPMSAFNGGMECEPS